MSEEFRRLRRKDISDLLGIEMRTVDKRIAKYGWEKERDEDGIMWVLVPERYIARNLPEATPETEQIENRPGMDPVAFHRVLESIRSEYSTRLEEKDEMIRLLKEQNAALNNQVQATNNAIQRYKSQDEELKAIRQAVESIRKPAPWQFWKR